MKVLKYMLAVATAVAIVGTPVLASAANSASKLSVSQVARAGTPARKASSLGGGGGSTIVALLAAVAVIAGIALAAGGSSAPKSP